jgi:hypothetical protein
MGNRLSTDEDDPLAGAPDEVLAAFIALGGRAARLREARRTVPAGGAYRAPLGAGTAQTQNLLLNRKA